MEIFSWLKSCINCFIYGEDPKKSPVPRIKIITRELIEFEIDCEDFIGDCMNVVKSYEMSLEDIYNNINLEIVVEMEVINMTLKDLSFLKNFPNLEILNLSFNNLTSLDTMPELPNLTKLNLSYNFLQDITQLKNQYNLRELYLHYNPLIDISPIKSLSELEILQAELIMVKDFNILDELKNLKYIALSKHTKYENLLKKINVFSDKDIIVLTNLTTFFNKFIIYNGTIYKNTIKF
jgi:Leucine-rich repeat (LRR) protein